MRLKTSRSQLQQRLGGSLLLLTLACSGGAAAADDVMAFQRQVRAVEERWLAHVADPQVVATLLADDFVHVLPGGFVDKREHLQYLRDHPDAFPGRKHFAALRIRIYGQTAVATGIVSSESAEGYSKLTAFTDVFVLRHGLWLAVSAQELPLSAAASQTH